MLPNISQNKSNQKMKLGELMHGMVNRIKQKNIFLTKYVKNQAGRLVQAVFLFLF